jgi:acyl transferase domain-containing protein
VTRLDVTGTSSFGLSGVNAHLLLTTATTAAPQPQQRASLPWQRQRFWPLPLLSAVLSAHLPSPDGGDRTVRLAAQPHNSQALAFLWDHRVQGRVLLPGTAMFELAAAAAAALSGDGSLPAAARPTLAALSIVSPKVLSALTGGGKVDSSQQAAAADVLLCEADTATGQVRVGSAPQGSSSAAAPVHLKADTVSAIPAAMAAAGNQRQALASTASPLRQAVGSFSSKGSGSTRSAGHTLAQPQLPAPTAASHAESFLMHPAVADATLHLGAVHVAAGSSRVSRVPVGVAAYSCRASRTTDIR